MEVASRRAPGPRSDEGIGLYERSGEVDRRGDFFFQAEDGIRDLTVTGVQTCALPISCLAGSTLRNEARGAGARWTARFGVLGRGHSAAMTAPCVLASRSSIALHHHVVIDRKSVV